MNNNVAKKIGISLIVGVTITALTYWYAPTTQGDYCTGTDLDYTIDCDLAMYNHGFPFTYFIEPNHSKNHGLQPMMLLTDIIVWSAIGYLGIFAIMKVKK